MTNTTARYMIGRAADGFQLGGGTLIHATTSPPYSHGPALCGRKPGRRSAGWSNDMPPETPITCMRCYDKENAE